MAGRWQADKIQVNLYFKNLSYLEAFNFLHYLAKAQNHYSGIIEIYGKICCKVVF